MRFLRWPVALDSAQFRPRPALIISAIAVSVCTKPARPPSADTPASATGSPMSAPAAAALEKRLAFPAGSAPAALLDRFVAGTSPTKQQLLGGDWVAIRILGSDGPRYDPTGVRVDDKPELRAEVVTFRIDSIGRFVMRRRAGDGMPSEYEPVTVPPDSGLTLYGDDEGDVGESETCRLDSSQHLVCLDFGLPGIGTEYVKQRVVPPSAHDSTMIAAFDLACAIQMDDGACRLPRPAAFLASSRLCFHSRFVLSRVTFSADGADSWLVLGPERTPRPTPRALVLFVEDSVATFGAWWQPSNPSFTQQTSRPALYPTPIEYLAGKGNSSMHGEINYGPSGFEGTVIGDSVGHQVGIEGVRAPCPPASILRR